MRTRYVALEIPARAVKGYRKPTTEIYVTAANLYVCRVAIVFEHLAVSVPLYLNHVQWRRNLKVKIGVKFCLQYWSGPETRSRLCRSRYCFPIEREITCERILQGSSQIIVFTQDFSRFLCRFTYGALLRVVCRKRE